MSPVQNRKKISAVKVEHILRRASAAQETLRTTIEQKGALLLNFVHTVRGNAS